MDDKQVAEFKKNQKKRNASLMRILNQSSPQLFSVVVAGRTHVLAENAFDPGASEYIHSELQKGQHQNYYAVLSLKD